MSHSHKRADEYDRRLVITEIYKRRHLLFGNVGTKDGKSLRTQAWKHIHAHAVRRGMYSSDKNWSYARDVLWFNFRKSVNNKIRSLEMGKKAILHDYDRMIMEIDRAKFQNALTYLPEVAEYDHSSFQRGSEVANEGTVTIKSEAVVDIGEDAQSMIPVSPVGFGEDEKDNEFEAEELPPSDEEMKILQKRHLQLQIRNLEIQNYKELLNVWKLEQELRMPPSAFTEHLC